MSDTRQFTIGGLSLPGHTALSLGPRHPTTAGLVRLSFTEKEGRVTDADVTSGYGHRAAEKLFEVRDFRTMIMLADRHDWVAAFSGELSLALTVENAMRLAPPPRATVLRTVLAELARIHSHLSFLSHLADDELNSRLWGLIDVLRDHTLAWTGNRVHPMLCRVGGLATDAPEGWLEALDPILDDVLGLSAGLRDALAATARFSGLAVLDRDTCLGYGLSGPVGRAAGVDLDRRRGGYLAYPEVFQPAPQRVDGDAEARLAVLIDELVAGVAMIRAARDLAHRTPGEVAVRLSRRLKVPEGEHSTDVEAPWGIASCLMVSRGGQTPWRVALRTPSFSNLSVLGRALEGAPTDSIADVVASLGYTVGDADK